MPVSDTYLQGQLEWLFAQQRFGIKPGLARVRELLDALGNPERAFEVVLVGGTNGKGSCSSTLATILHSAGWRSALFTSPHLTHFRERFVVAGETLPDEEVAAALTLVREPAEKIGATFFEIVTALACLLFARAGVEIAVMEVGIGGRFDATNALEPRLSVITNVALDHTEILGDTPELIAVEKAGILRPDKLGLTGAEGVALGILRDQTIQTGATLWALDDEVEVAGETLGWDGVRIHVTSPLGSLHAQTPLLGRFQARNVALAAVAAQALGATNGDIAAGIARTRWPGRLEPIPFAGRTFLLDGAHNPQAAAVLASALRDLGVAPVPLIFGVANEKAISEMVSALEPVVSVVTLTRATLSPRAALPEALVPLWQRPVHLAQTPRKAIAQVLEHTSLGDTIAVAGSLYLIGEVRPILLGDEAEEWARYQ